MMVFRIRIFSCKLTTLTTWFGMIRILTFVDATRLPPMVTNNQENIGSSNASDPSDMLTRSPGISHLPGSVLPSKTTMTGMTTKALVTSEKPISFSTLTPQYSTSSIDQENEKFTKEVTTLDGKDKLNITFKSTTDSSLSPSGTTLEYPLTTNPNTLSTEVKEEEQATPNNTVKCTSLRNLISTSKVVCFKYSEDTTCDTLEEEKKSELLSYLCKIVNTTSCHINIHSSEIKKGCILWVPTTQVAEDRLMDDKFSIHKTLEQISDHQTRSQKTMIALVTCGVLLAFFILTGYFLSNRESWSPERQRLGEDPYYTETDNQENTLVSVSTNNLEKPNRDNKENGTGQTINPAATNGQRNKKQNVSDTEL